MTLLGFNPQNHPHQVGKRGAKDTVDERHTPRSLWEPLNERLRFTVDVAANSSNALCDRFYDLESDGLSQDWTGERVWCNPPYSGIRPWVEKANTLEAELVVMLLPANRTEQKWWQECVEPYRESQIATRFLPGRINFGTPDNPSGKYHTSAPFGCVLLAWGCSL